MWPVVDQCVALSIVVSPVTVTAEVEVNKASKKLVTVPVLDAAGSISKKVPKRIRAVKAAAITCVEDSLDRFGISNKSILLSFKSKIEAFSSKALEDAYASGRLWSQGSDAFEPGNRTIFYRRFRTNSNPHGPKYKPGHRLDDPLRLCFKAKQFSEFRPKRNHSGGKQ